MELSEDQKDAFDQIIEWYKSGTNLTLSLGGYAGSGKTTLISYLRQFFGERIKVAFMCYTGKATSVLRRKLNDQNLLYRFPQDTCSTIHSSIYQPIIEDDEIIEWILKSSIDCDIIIVDESSMISKEIYEDLTSYGKSILFVGDHGQLPPIGDNFDLMQNPDIRLEKIHRLAENNPIIQLSIVARNEGFIDYGYYGDSVAKVSKKDPLITEFIKNSGTFSDTAILCGFNKTRVKINKKIRDFFKHSDINNFPVQGERVICLKNNKFSKFCPIYNGILGTVKKCQSEGTYLDMEIDIDGESDYYKGFVSFEAFNNDRPVMKDFPIKLNKEQRKIEKKEFVYSDYFDFGYCLSVHKSQGSEWKRIMVIEEPCQYWSGDLWNKWLYTAITRSSEQLLLVR